VENIGIVRQRSVEVFYIELKPHPTVQALPPCRHGQQPSAIMGVPFRSFRKTTAKSNSQHPCHVWCLSVCPSICNNWAPTGRIFIQLYWGCSLTAIDQMQVWLITQLLSLRHLWLKISRSLERSCLTPVNLDCCKSRFWLRIWFWQCVMTNIALCYPYTAIFLTSYSVAPYNASNIQFLV